LDGHSNESWCSRAHACRCTLCALLAHGGSALEYLGRTDIPPCIQESTAHRSELTRASFLRDDAQARCCRARRHAERKKRTALQSTCTSTMKFAWCCKAHSHTQRLAFPLLSECSDNASITRIELTWFVKKCEKQFPADPAHRSNSSIRSNLSRPNSNPADTIESFTESLKQYFNLKAAHAV
jgi:hypothetical protein